MINYYFFNLYPLSVTARNYEYVNRIPLIRYTHGSFVNTNNFEKHIKKFNSVYKKKIIMLRDPRDVVVSYYHHRISSGMTIKGTRLSDFLHSEEGIKRIVDYMNKIERKYLKYIIIIE